MLLLRRPTAEKVRAFLAGQSHCELSYTRPMGGAVNPLDGYVQDHTRIKLGAGEEVFDAARAALQHWRQFQTGWLEALPENSPIREGEMVAILARVFGLWWLNACRIVQVFDEDGALRRFGFSYGTCPDHAGRGEERFLIEWDRADDSVWYDVFAFSGPGFLLARLGYPLMRRVQKSFGQQSAAAMRAALDALKR